MSNQLMTIYGINSITGAAKNNKLKTVFTNNEKIKGELKQYDVEFKDYDDFDFGNNKFLENINTQGVVALAEEYKIYSDTELISINKEKINPVLIIADHITDPQNMGAILRNIAAFNGDGLIIADKNQSPINATAIHTSAGNAYLVDVAKTNSLSTTITRLKQAGYWIVSTKMDADKTIKDLSEFNAPVAIILGSEGKGISSTLQKMSDLSIKINMNEKVESLNVASTSAIVLHALNENK